MFFIEILSYLIIAINTFRISDEMSSHAVLKLFRMNFHISRTSGPDDDLIG